MNSQVLSLLVFLGLLSVLVAITELLHRVLKLPVEQSRKFLHVSGGLMCLLFPSFFTSHWWLLPLAVISFLLLFITRRRKLLNSIHKTRRRTVGSILFPIPVYGCFLLAEVMHNNLFYYLPISLLTISDTAAETAGLQWAHRSKQFFNGQKTLAGTLAFFITALPVCAGWLYHYDHSIPAVIGLSLMIASVAAITELVTLHGWDNLTVPLMANAVLMVWLCG